MNGLGGGIMTNPYHIQSIDRAFKLLDIISASQHPLSLDDIAKKSELNRNTVFKILSSLTALGMVHSEKYKGYSLGFGIVRYYNSLVRSYPMLNIVKDYLTKLRDVTHETTGMYIESGTQVFLIASKESREPVKRVFSGRPSPSHRGAAGKIFWAYKTDRERDKILGDIQEIEYASGKVLMRQEFYDMLDQIKRDGKAVSIGEALADVWAVSAPVFDKDGKIIACISCSGPISRAEPEHIQFCMQETKKYAEQLNLEIQELPWNVTIED